MQSSPAEATPTQEHTQAHTSTHKHTHAHTRTPTGTQVHNQILALSQMEAKKWKKTKSESLSKKFRTKMEVPLEETTEFDVFPIYSYVYLFFFTRNLHIFTYNILVIRFIIFYFVKYNFKWWLPLLFFGFYFLGSLPFLFVIFFKQFIIYNIEKRYCQLGRVKKSYFLEDHHSLYMVPERVLRMKKIFRCPFH